MKVIKHICELNAQIILDQDRCSNKAPQLTARVIVRNMDGLYAVMYAEKFGLHSLPDGGIEDSEDILTALRREVFEGTSCTCNDIQELGIVPENRVSLDYTQINYFYVVTTADTPGEKYLTDADTIVEWHTPDKMIRLIHEQEFERIQGKHLTAHDLVGLQDHKKHICKHYSCVIT